MTESPCFTAPDLGTVDDFDEQHEQLLEIETGHQESLQHWFDLAEIRTYSVAHRSGVERLMKSEGLYYWQAKAKDVAATLQSAGLSTVEAAAILGYAWADQPEMPGGETGDEWVERMVDKQFAEDRLERQIARVEKCLSWARRRLSYTERGERSDFMGSCSCGRLHGSL